jgi:hypothetical protein
MIVIHFVPAAFHALIQFFKDQIYSPSWCLQAPEVSVMAAARHC